MFFLESFLSSDLDVFYYNLFFRKSIIEDGKTLDMKTFTPRVLWKSSF